MASDDDERFVHSHPRFAGISNDLSKGVPGGEWTIRITDDGHVITITGERDDVIRRAADALRRLP